MWAIDFIWLAAVRFLSPIPSADCALALARPDGLDRWALHGRLGLPIMLLVFGLAAELAIRLGGLAIPAAVAIADALIVVATDLSPAGANAPAAALGGGLRLLAIWLPPLIAFELILATLRDCGYLARAACAIDRLLWALRLPGRAFAPMLAGQASALPRRCGSAAERARACAVLPQAVAGWPVCLLLAMVCFPGWGGSAALAIYLAAWVLTMIAALLVQACWPGRREGPPLPRPLLPAWRWPHPARALPAAMPRLAGLLAVAGLLLAAWCIGLPAV